jgi:hypothetical protein
MPNDNSPLTLADIADARAYERERGEYRASVMALKARRRIHLGTIMTLLFENRETIRFQVQEMARAEKMTTDAQILHELATYNPLIPSSGELSATMFIECTDEQQMRYWFPRLIGVERTLEFQLGEGSSAHVVRCSVDPDHEKQLTRDDITSAVHYIKWSFTPAERDAFTAGPVRLVCTHPNYEEATELTIDARTELLSDLS